MFAAATTSHHDLQQGELFVIWLTTNFWAAYLQNCYVSTSSYAQQHLWDVFFTGKSSIFLSYCSNQKYPIYIINKWSGKEKYFLFLTESKCKGRKKLATTGAYACWNLLQNIETPRRAGLGYTTSSLFRCTVLLRSSPDALFATRTNRRLNLLRRSKVSLTSHFF